MASNSTDDGSGSLWKYIVYIGEGGITSFGNMLLFLTIVRYRALKIRKEYIVLGGLAFADALNGFAYFICGIYRTALVVTHRHHVLVSHWDCMMKPHNIIWAFSDSISSLMLVVVSVDRFISVGFPLQYIGMPLMYSYSLVGSAYGYTLVSGLFAIYVSSTLPAGNNWGAVCFTSMALGPIYSKYLLSFFLFGLLSIVGYIMVWIAYRKNTSKVLPHDTSTQAKQQLRTQRKITQSLGLSCIFTFFLFVLPMMMNTLSTAVDYSATGLTVIPLYAFMWSNLNPLLNVFIFYFRHREIRFAMKNLVIFKELPGDMRLWNMDQTKASKSQAISHRSQNTSKRPTHRTAHA